MSFGGLGYIPPPGIIAAPVNTLTFKADYVLPEPLAFAKRFPVWMQQYVYFQPQGKINTVFPDGWRTPAWDALFKPLFPACEQSFIGGSGKGSVPTWF